MARMDKRPPKPGDVAYGIFYSGAVGGSVVAIVFLATDIMAGRPFFTPSLLGSVAFLGGSTADAGAVNLTAVALFTLVHFAAFGSLGALATVVFRATLARDLSPTVVTGLTLFAAMEGGMYLASGTVMPGVVQALGGGTVLVANALTALAMSLFLQRTLTSGPEDVEESEAELMEGPGMA